MKTLCLYGIAGLMVAISCIASRDQTVRALKIAFKKFCAILPAFSVMLIIVSVALFIFPDEALFKYLGGQNSGRGIIFASLIGSVAIVPGFIAFPLCGILLNQGVSYTVLSAFATTLMMVGVLTYPVEKEYFGFRVTVLRNAIGFCIAMIVALATGIFFGEIF